MQTHTFGRLWPVSTLALGGGGLGMLWGPTTFDECVATVHDAVAAGISLLDLAPRYGDGKAKEVVGEAFAGRLPDGVRVTSKCNLGEPLAYQIEDALRRSIEDSLTRPRLSRIDPFFLHSNVVPDAAHIAGRPDAAARMTLYSTFVEHVRPVFEKLMDERMIRAWGLTASVIPTRSSSFSAKVRHRQRCSASPISSTRRAVLNSLTDRLNRARSWPPRGQTVSALWAFERCRPAR
jgi:aryl-alcohol dehydrogenase-like predicted oxidoreductase